MLKKILKTQILLAFLVSNIFSQVVSTCDGTVPSFIADLSAGPTEVFISEHISREGLCCDNYWPDRCIEFEVTTHPSAIGIIFDVELGANPPGALFYRVDCGEEIHVGEVACIKGPGPHLLTFCKPGANKNIYSITSVPGVLTPDTVEVVEGCAVDLHIEGDINESTIEWNEITSGTGIYNNLLSSTTGEDTVLFSSILGLPDFIEYRVCAKLNNQICGGDTTFCDTVLVKILRTIEVNLNIDDLEVCTDNPSPTNIVANVTGSYEDLVYQWFRSEPTYLSLGTSNNITVNTSGKYGVIVYDRLHPACRRDTAYTSINFYPIPNFTQPPNTIGCAGEQTVFSVTGPHSYFWYLSDSTLCTDCNTLNYTFTENEIIYIQSISEEGCSNIESFSVWVNPSKDTTIDAYFCEGSNYQLPDNSVTNTPGSYEHHLTTQSGCDSTVYTNLTMYTTSYANRTDVICENDSFLLPNNTYAYTEGLYIINLLSSKGCDSVVTHNIIVNSDSTYIQQIDLCEGDYFTLPDGQNVYESGIYYDTTYTAMGCSFIQEFKIGVYFASDVTINDTICMGSNYLLPDGSLTQYPGEYVFQFFSKKGCDSVIHVNLFVAPNYQTTQNASICSGENFLLPDGQNVQIAGLYTTNLTSKFGCDSLVHTNLTIRPQPYFINPISFCDGESYTLPSGKVADSSGIYIDTLTSHLGCDSIIESRIEELKTYSTYKSADICSGENYTLPSGIIVNQAGTYTEQLLTHRGCDSTISIVLDVTPLHAIEINDTICEYSSYTLPNGTITSDPGKYEHSFLSASGCDSNVTTYLIVLTNYNIEIDTQLCEGDSILLSNGSYTKESITDTEIYNSAFGCDSIINTNIRFHPRYDIVMNDSLCAGDIFTLPDGSDATANGHYYFEYNTHNGCDSNITVNLFFAPTYTTSDFALVCNGEGYELPDGSMVYASGNYTTTLTSALGCDSIITTVLAYNSDSIIVQEVAICETETYSLPNGQTISEEGIYTDSSFSGSGCLIVQEFHLTVKKVDTTFIQSSICEGETYTLPNGNTTNIEGNYSNIMASSNGCDSIVITHLTVYPTYNVHHTAVICENETYELANGTFTEDAGTYVQHFSTIHGCDSLITEVVVINSDSTNIQNITLCSGSTFTLPNGESISESGIFKDTTFTSSGCQFIQAYYIEVIQSKETFLSDTICSGENYILPDGSIATATGLYEHRFTSNSGCDSVVYTNLLVIPNSNQYVLINLCPNTSYTLPGGEEVFDPGIYTDTITFGSCYLIQETEIILVSEIIVEQEFGLCSESDFTLPSGEIVSESGVYIDTLLSSTGCDSIIATTLEFLKEYEVIISDTICEGEEYLLPDNSMATATGIYEHHFSTINGCDSVVITNLTIIPNSNQYLLVQLCPNTSYILPGGEEVFDSGIYIDSISFGDCYFIQETEIISINATLIEQEFSLCLQDEFVLPGGESVSESGIYFDTLASSSGCDSIIKTILEFHQQYEIFISDTICEGEEYQLPDGSKTTVNGEYNHSFLSQFGCDSIINTLLTVIPGTRQVDTIYLCQLNSYILPGGQEVFESGTYIDTIGNGSCFYVHETELILGQQQIFQVTMELCEGETYLLSNGETIIDAGTYVDTIKSISGCDSIVTYTVSIHNVNNIQLNENICQNESYTLPDSSIVNTSGTYVFNYKNKYGCDSIVTINLFIKESFNQTVSINHCDEGSGLIINGVQIFSDTTFSSIYPSNRYCDSSVTYNVKYGTHKITTFNASTCKGISLEIGDKIYTNEGTYFDTLTSHTGCDSVVIIYFKVYPWYQTQIDTSLCGTNFFEFGGQTYYESGIYSLINNTVHGCDSITILNLKLDEAPEVTVRSDTTIQEGELVESYTTYVSEENLEFQWYVNNESIDASVESFIQRYYEDTEISIEVRKGENCKARDSYRIKIEGACPEDLVTAPNVITPNYDGANDVFKVLNPFNVKIEMVNIFNRWGELVYEANDFSYPWDGSFRGQVCNPGIFTYYIRGYCISGNAFEKVGNITLIR